MKGNFYNRKWGKIAQQKVALSFLFLFSIDAKSIVNSAGVNRRWFTLKERQLGVLLVNFKINDLPILGSIFSGQEVFKCDIT